MKKRFFIMGLTLILCMMFLQGCSTEAETSIKVVTDEKATRIEATLKADESKNYKWMYFSKNNNITESASDFSNDLFSDTYTQKYAIVLDREEGVQDVLYFVLYKEDNLEEGKVFEYDVYYDKDGKVVLGEQKSGQLEHRPEILEKVKKSQ